MKRKFRREIGIITKKFGISQVSKDVESNLEELINEFLMILLKRACEKTKKEGGKRLLGRHI